MAKPKFKLVPEILKEFDPQKSFVELPAFKFTFYTAVGIAVCAASIIIGNSKLTWDFSYEGFNRAIEIFKVPLGILAITIPIIALIATNHRSVQTKEQIKLSDEQNRFSNHFKHIEEFEKYCASHEKNSFHFVRSKRKLHSRLFPSSRSGNHRLTTKIQHEVDSLIAEFSKAYSFFGSNEITMERRISNQEFEDARMIYRAAEEVKKYLHIEDNPEKISSQEMLEADGSVIAKALTMAREVSLTISFIYEIFQFDESFSPSPLIVEMSRIPLLDMESEHKQIKRVAAVLGRLDALNIEKN